MFLFLILFFILFCFACIFFYIQFLKKDEDVEALYDLVYNLQSSSYEKYFIEEESKNV